MVWSFPDEAAIGNLALAFEFGIITASVIALAAVGVTLQFGVTNYVNFAFGSYLGLGGFVAWELNVHLGINFWLATLCSGLFMAVFAVVVSRLILDRFVHRKTPPVYMLIVTLGLWLMLSSAMLIIWGADIRQFNVGASTPVHVGPFVITDVQVLVIVGAAAILVGLHLLLTRTTLGKTMRAMSDDGDLARISGIDTDFVVTATWLLSGFLMGIAGCALALVLSGFAVNYADAFLFVIFSAVIVGGIGQPYGTMLGALIVGLGTEMSALVVNSAFKVDTAFVLLILMLLIRPQGLIPSRGRH